MIKATWRSHSGSSFMLFLMLYYIGISGLLPLGMMFLARQGFVVGAMSLPILFIFSQVVGLLLPLGLWLAVKKDKLTHHLPNMKLGKSNLIYIFFISLFLQPTLMMVSALMSLVTPNIVSEVILDMAAVPLWLMVLSMAVAPAICEELVFRGYIQSQYKHYAIKKAAIINGLFFGIIHMNLHQFVYAFIMGIIFAYMVYYTRSVRAGVLSHFIMNASQVTLAHLGLRAMAEAGDYVTAYTVIPVGDSEIIFTEQMAVLFAVGFMGLVSLFTIPCVYILFRSFVSHNRSRNMKYDMQQALGVGASETTETADVVEKVEEIDEEKENEPTRKFPADPFSIAVVVLFVVIVIVPVFVS